MKIAVSAWGRRLRHYSKPQRIILLRHCESMGNVNPDIYATTPDNQIPLTDLGIKQAHQAGRELRELVKGGSVFFYYSPYVRTQQTFAILHEYFPQASFMEEPRLREQEWGNYQDPKLMPVLFGEREKIGAFYYRFPSGESGADVYDRVSTVIGTLIRDFRKRSFDNVILVTHGLFCRLFLTRWYHWTIEKFHALENLENCQMLIMEKKIKKDHETYELTSEMKMRK
jgi:broad specificity phosphatase PhoE